jgi:hypothetical protein
MSFARQVRGCLVWGGILLLLGGGALWSVQNGQADPRLRVVGNLGLATIGIGAVLVLFGGVMRPLQRRFYLMAMESAVMFSSRPTRQVMMDRRDAFLWRWWLHLDPVGRPRDGG